jgi:hypothetical protein
MMGWDPTTTVDLIIATDLSVTLGAENHSWVIVTADEDILLQGGGPEDCNIFLIQS